MRKTGPAAFASSDPSDAQSVQPVQHPDPPIDKASYDRSQAQVGVLRKNLLESEQRYRQVVHGLPVAVYTCDAEGRILLYNEAAVELWGRAPKPGEAWCGSHKIYRPDDSLLPIPECPMAVCLKTGRAVRGEEIVIERPDGTRRYVLPYPEPIFDSSGQVIGAINVLIDNTERKNTEIAMGKLAAIVESSQDAIIGKDLNGIISSWNEAAQRLFGYTAEEMIGKPVMMLIPPGRRNEETEILRRIHAGEQVKHFETIRVNKAGERLHISLSVSPIKDASGRIVGASKIARDITEMRRVQETLAAAAIENRRLYEAVQKELSEHKETEEELSKSNKELEQFAYIASHDLQEPLHMINSFVDLLTRRCYKKLDDHEREYLDFIRQGATRAKTLIRELLEFSRIGRAEDVQRLSLQTVLREVEGNLSAAIKESGAVIRSASLPTVMASHLEMVQLFQNLISNAIKYRSLVPPQIDISVSKTVGAMWEFAVKDNGIGIEPRYRERIFGMFQRLHSQSDSSGTGIGLAVCQKIVQNQGGNIWVESEPGQGSTFYFTLPMV
jgi:PAS domain S-box-containing protein